jgi:UDP-glucuronate 4-epimerase
MGTLNLLEVMKKNNVKKLLFASSSSVYGNNKKVPFSENDFADHPISPYATSKKSAELLGHTYYNLYGFDIFCLRFFTVYGPRQRPDLAIHKFVDKILAGTPIEMYGDGDTGRDYTYIDDVVTAIVSAMNKIKGYEVINIGGSREVLLKNMISTIEKALDVKAHINIKEMQPGDVKKTFADISKAEKLLGFKSTFSFEEGIEKFIEWKKK